MSNNNQDSLKSAIKKRKTQEMLREIEDRQTTIATGAAPSQAQPKRTTQTITPLASAQPDPKRATAIHEPVTAPAKGLPFKLTRKTKLIAAVSISVVLLLAGVVLLLPANTPFGANVSYLPTFPALPTFAADDVIAHFRAVGVPVNGLQKMAPAQLVSWHTDVGFSFKVQQAADQGQFMLFTYADDEGANLEAFRVSVNNDYKLWHTIKESNVLLLASPTTSPNLLSEIASHVRQYLLAPYRSFLPTSTATVKP